MEEGYSICLNEWALDRDIKNELGLLLIISSLCAEKGYCFASNEYLANLFDTDESQISRKIAKLVEKGYLTVDYKRRGTEVVSREIRLTNLSTDRCQKTQPTIDKKRKDKNISINNISLKERTNKFVRPSKQEIKDYIAEKNLNVDADSFYDYFEATGWIDSKGNHVKSWKGKLQTWSGFHKQSTKTNDEADEIAKIKRQAAEEWGML